MKSALVLAAVLLAAEIVSADPAANEFIPVLDCPKLQDAPVIDGRLGKSEWFDAASYSGLVQVYPEPKGIQIRERFEYRLGHTDSHFYFAFRVYRDSAPKSSTPGRGENCGREVWKDDAVEIMLDVGDARKNGINIAMNANSDYSDFKIYPPLKDKWNSRWNYKAAVTSSGWEGELAIPFSQLETVKPKPGERWRIDIILNRKTPSVLVARAGDFPGNRIKWTDMHCRPFLRFSQDCAVPHCRRQKDTWNLACVNPGARPVQGRFAARLWKRTVPGSFREDIDRISPEAMMKEHYRLHSELVREIHIPPFRKAEFDLPDGSGLAPGTYLQLLELKDPDGNFISRQLFPFVKPAPLAVKLLHASLHTAQTAAEVHFEKLFPAAKGGMLQFDISLNGTARDSRKIKVNSAHAAVLLKYPEAKSGDDLTIRTRLFDRNGKCLADERQYRKIPVQPDWLRQIPAISKETVPYPWHGLETEKNGLGMTGRFYHYGRNFLPEQITAAGKKLFGAPPKLTAAMDDGSIEELGLIRGNFAGSGVRVRHGGKNESGKLQFEYESETEFDGFQWNRFRIRPQGRKIRELVLTFRLKPEHAVFFNHSYKGLEPFRTTDCGNWGRIPASGLSLPFVYGLWVGDLERGLTLAFESDRHWNTSGRNGAVSIRRNGQNMELSIHFIRNGRDNPEEMSFGFGLQATPVRPWMVRNHTDGFFTIGIAYQKNDPAGLEQWIKANAGKLRSNGGNFGFLWSAGGPGFGHPFLPHQVESNIVTLRKNPRSDGENYLYYCGWAGNSQMKEVEAWQDEMIRAPKAAWGGDDLFKQCPAGMWSEMYLAGVSGLVDRCGLCGVYMDQTTELSSCSNLVHGCGYLDPEGKIHPTFPVRKMRRFYQKLYRMLLRKCGKDRFAVYSHNSTQPIFTPVDAFISRRCAFEILAKEEDHGKIIGFDRIAGGYNPSATGIPMEATWWNGFHRTLKNNELMSVLWLFGCTLKGVQWKMDSSFREGYGPDEHAEIGVMRALRRLNSDDLRFHPFWQPKPYRSSLHSSCWISPKKRQMLVILSNVSGTEQHGELGHFRDPVRKITDAVTGEIFPLTDNKINLPVPAKGYRAIIMEY